MWLTSCLSPAKVSLIGTLNQSLQALPLPLDIQPTFTTVEEGIMKEKNELCCIFIESILWILSPNNVRMTHFYSFHWMKRSFLDKFGLRDVTKKVLKSYRVFKMIFPQQDQNLLHPLILLRKIAAHHLEGLNGVQQYIQIDNLKNWDH